MIDENRDENRNEQVRKEVYFCTKCEQVVIRNRPLGLKPYVKWCCGEKMVLINTKCDICGMKIKGKNHFQGRHHLAKVGG